MTIELKIGDFLAGGPYAVVGASTNRAKYGNKVLRCYLQNERRPVYPINPRADEVEGQQAFAALNATPERPRSISIITPPAITETVVEVAIELGIEHLWMQPGAESPAAVARAEEAGLNVIADGSCLLVVLGYRE
jgi:predicted CoA-binding protein